MKMNIKGLSGLHSSLWAALFFSPLASIFWASSFVLYIFILLPWYPGVGKNGGGYVEILEVEVRFPFLQYSAKIMSI
jgi:hypothetical protein